MFASTHKIGHTLGQSQRKLIGIFLELAGIEHAIVVLANGSCHFGPFFQPPLGETSSQVLPPASEDASGFHSWGSPIHLVNAPQFDAWQTTHQSHQGCSPGRGSFRPFWHPRVFTHEEASAPKMVQTQPQARQMELRTLLELAKLLVAKSQQAPRSIV